MSETRHYQVGMSVEALASAWARTEDAPAGSAVVVDTEIAARLRGGTPWKLGGDAAVMMGMIARPKIDPLHEALLWLVASLGAADALTESFGVAHTIIWPDRVIRHGDSSPRCSTNLMVQLGPGRIDHAVLVARVELRDSVVDTEALIGSLHRHLEATIRLVESDRPDLIEKFTERCSIMGERVKVELLPRGESRGLATAVDADGFLVLESPTGMLERVAPASLRSLTVIAAS